MHKYKTPKLGYNYSSSFKAKNERKNTNKSATINKMVRTEKPTGY